MFFFCFFRACACKRASELVLFCFVLSLRRDLTFWRGHAWYISHDTILPPPPRVPRENRRTRACRSKVLRTPTNMCANTFPGPRRTTWYHHHHHEPNQPTNQPTTHPNPHQDTSKKSRPTSTSTSTSTSTYTALEMRTSLAGSIRVDRALGLSPAPVHRGHTAYAP